MPVSPPRVLLFLAACPTGTTPRALDREVRAIQHELERSHGRHFTFETRWAVTPLELLRSLRRLKPTIVHFAGDGSPVGGLMMHGRADGAHPVSSAALRQAFAVAGTSVRLVVLNACYSAPVAEALVRHVDCVVGMSEAISPEAARAFAIGFYGALADGEPTPAAFEYGKAAIGLDVLDGLAEANQPQLRFRRYTVGWRAAWRSAGRALGPDLRIGAHFAGALGIATVVIAAVIAWRGAFLISESTLDLRVEKLAVVAAQPPQPVQHADTVRAVQTVAAVDPQQGFHRIVLRGGFASIDVAGPRQDNPVCQLRFTASDDSLAVERAAADGTPCTHQVVAIANKSGAALMIDDELIRSIVPYDRIVLHIQPGAPVRLQPQQGRIALFRPTDAAQWPVNHVEGVAADGEYVGLPGGLRNSDSVAIDGAIELRELRLDDGRLVARGALRHWRGSVGNSADWNSAAPWPPVVHVEYVAAGLVALALLAVARVYMRWRAWKMEL